MKRGHIALAITLLLWPAACFGDAASIIDWWFHRAEKYKLIEFMNAWNDHKYENAMAALHTACGGDLPCWQQINGIPRQRLANMIFDKFGDLEKLDLKKVDDNLDFFYNHRDLHQSLVDYMTDVNAGRANNGLNHLISACGQNDECVAQMKSAFRSGELTKKVIAKLDVKCNWDNLKKDASWEFQKQHDAWLYFVGKLTAEETGHGPNGAMSYLYDTVLSDDMKSVDNFGACQKEDRHKFHNTVRSAH